VPKSSTSNPLFGYDLPELDDVDPTQEPVRHLRKAEGSDALEVVEGRRPSPLLCVPKLRDAVAAWRNAGYPGGSETTQSLFRWWFLDAHGGVAGRFRPYFVQREAIETLVYLLEVEDAPDIRSLLERYHHIQDSKLFDEELEFQHSTSDELKVLIPGHADSIPISPGDVARYAIKAATGSGKTMIMALYITWSYFHAVRESDSKQASNFLIVAPNVIVFERLKVDFANSHVFHSLQLAPPGWNLDLHVILRGDAREPIASGNLVVTNIQQLYDNRSAWKPKNPVERILGRPVVRNAAPGRPIIDRVSSLASLAVLNDEAHHVHDPDLTWNQILTGLHQRISGGLTSWLDFSATPRFRNGAAFPWVVSDYPLAQAVEDRVVKTPILVKAEGPTPRAPKKQAQRAAKVTASQYSQWIRTGVERLKAHERIYKGVDGAKPVMFVMCENVAHAEDVAKYLKDKNQRYGFKDDEILVIHTKGSGEIRDGDLDELRRQSRLIDEDASRIRVVVSVLILREGWDVRNVTVVLGLRPANSKNEILPEQAIGRGLRLMRGVHGRQVLEVIGTESFEEILGGLETEGVYIDQTRKPPQQVRIEPIKERLAYDIAIPRTGPLLQRNQRKIGDLRPEDIPTSFTPDDLTVDLTSLRVEFIDVASGQPLGKGRIKPGPAPLEGDVVGSITRRALASARIPEGFATLYPIVRAYLQEHAFGETIDLGRENLLRLLALPEYEQWLAGSVADALGRVVTERAQVRLEPQPLRLSETPGFIWRRQTSKATKTVFNFMATFNNFESEFGKFLDGASDVEAFSALAETFTRFSVSYLKPSGALGLYYPDWVVRQRAARAQKMWIVETKGREFDGVTQKDAAIAHWCSQVSEHADTPWGYVRVNQDWWDRVTPRTFQDVADGVKAYQSETGASGIFYAPNT